MPFFLIVFLVGLFLANSGVKVGWLVMVAACVCGAAWELRKLGRGQ
jgi:hypothetical protein